MPMVSALGTVEVKSPFANTFKVTTLELPVLAVAITARDAGVEAMDGTVSGLLSGKFMLGVVPPPMVRVAWLAIVAVMVRVLVLVIAQAAREQQAQGYHRGQDFYHLIFSPKYYGCQGFKFANSTHG